MKRLQKGNMTKQQKEELRHQFELVWIRWTQFASNVPASDSDLHAEVVKIDYLLDGLRDYLRR